MYDVKNRKWKSDCENEDLLHWSQEPANASQPESQFIRASQLLEKNRQGGDVAEAVALMEEAAKAEYPKAVFAMGQMFYWGWAVSKDRKLALEWYNKAAKLNYKPAIRELESLKRRKIRNIASVCAALVLAAAVTVGAFYVLSGMSGKLIIKVNRETELRQTTTLEEFGTELQGLIAAYDDELVVSGQVSTNRLILRFEGNRLDLSDFLADKVVARDDNKVIIQFSSEEEAKRCLEELRKRGDIVYVEFDEYSTTTEAVREKDSSLPIITDIYPNDPSYMSWGIADMGLDQLRDYVAATYPDNSVLVGVVDTGVSGFVADLPMVVAVYNAAAKNTPYPVPDKHGTHVTGTVIDGTYGTNTAIVCVDVFNGQESAADSAVNLGVEFCVQAGAKVINMSLSGQGYSNDEIYTLRAALDADVVVVRTAGNNGINVADRDNCMSVLPDLFVVGAYDIDHSAADFSNYGNIVDICAPGVDIFSFKHDDETQLISLNGTSMAAPHITALVALVRLMYPEMTALDVQELIQDYCRTFRNPDMYASGMYGAGAPDATKFIEKNPDIN